MRYEWKILWLSIPANGSKAPDNKIEFYCLYSRCHMLFVIIYFVGISVWRYWKIRYPPTIGPFHELNSVWHLHEELELGFRIHPHTVCTEFCICLLGPNCGESSRKCDHRGTFFIGRWVHSWGLSGKHEDVGALLLLTLILISSLPLYFLTDFSICMKCVQNSTRWKMMKFMHIHEGKCIGIPLPIAGVLNI